MSTLPTSSVPLFKLKVSDRGVIKDIKEQVVRVEGLRNCLNGELVDLGGDIRGIIMGFTEAETLVLMLGDNSRLRMGQPVTGISEPLTVPVGDGLLGRMVTALGQPCDEQGPIKAAAHLPAMRDSPPITAREPVSEQLPTGTKMIDAVVPLAKGQRQLILGDRVTGKTSVALDAILNQRGRDCLCVFCGIGKSRSAIQRAMSVLKSGGALDYTAIVAAPDSAPAGEQFLVPYAATAVAEYFSSRGRDVLVVFDDLTKHAWAYRQLSLLLNRPPGREAYPGDIFYVQTQLMERAGNFTAEAGGGSITFLGIAETLQGDLTGYIPSNLVAMCDGQICMSATAFAEGIRPAIDLLLSLSIIGRHVQPPIVGKLGKGLRALIAQHHELARLGALQSGLSEASMALIRKASAIFLLLQQPEQRPVSLAELVLVLAALRKPELIELPPAVLMQYRDGIGEYAHRHVPELLAAIERAHDLTPEVERGLEDLLQRFLNRSEAPSASGRAETET